MSLIAFHRLLISAGILFCLGFAGWEIWQVSRESRPGSLVLAVVFVLLGAALIFYLRRLNRILGYEQQRKD